MNFPGEMLIKCIFIPDKIQRKNQRNNFTQVRLIEVNRNMDDSEANTSLKDPLGWI